METFWDSYKSLGDPAGILITPYGIYKDSSYILWEYLWNPYTS